MSIGFAETSLVGIELPYVPEHIPLVIDDCSLAFHLGYRTKTLWWVLTAKDDHYTVHRILKNKSKRGKRGKYAPKKEYRIIHAPSTFMKPFLRRVHTRFLVPLQDQLGPHVTAYRKGLSTRHAVAQHIPVCAICDDAEKGKTPKKHDCPRSGAVIQMDLSDFFGSTRRAWIRNYLKAQGYSHYVAGLLASVLTVDDLPNQKPVAQRRKGEPNFFTGVPQGAPTSGAICNLVADWKIDHKILLYLADLDKEQGLEGEWRWRYTRYSDDICLTCGKDFPREEKKKICDDVIEIIQREGYRINPRKTRIGHSFFRKSLLGMVFNQKPNMAKERYLALKAMVHNALTQGIDTQYKRAGKVSAEAYISYLEGNVNYACQILEKSNPDRAAKLQIELAVAVENHRVETAAAV